MNREKDNNSKERFNIEEQLSIVGKQVSEFLEEKEEFQKDHISDFKTEMDSKSRLIEEHNSKEQSAENDYLTQQVATFEEESSSEITHGEIKNVFISDESDLEIINDSLAEQISHAIVEDATLQEKVKVKKNRRRKVIIGLSSAAVVILFLVIFFSSKFGQKKVVEGIGNLVYDDAFDYESITPTVSPEQIPSDTISVTPTITDIEQLMDENVVNILLIGIEEIEYAQNTDTMIIASMNRKSNELSIISLMRDLYVDIPGHSDNKLNAAYQLGGIDLLYKTIQMNFGITMDGYVMVNFDCFETIVDLLGGIPITLSTEEAMYLNEKNYISNIENRNVVAGTQILNGNQVLGYCRVRHVSTGNENDDFGRTARHRTVLEAIYKKIMNKNLFQILAFMNQVFANVQLKTDITKNKFSDYLTEVVDFNIGELEQYRIPANQTYYNSEVLIGKHYQEVLIPNDWNETRDLLKDYIYGSILDTE